ncbi:PHD finger protein ING1 isoform X1 [Rhododendron vialii]|uniref:PHD finger protein ING1 isoform X1 n=1 Tax=Rhododendron vialii TaxID=182163 RepID=UPI00265F0FBD|nr:PHD finger protein ING1 isoform X1 [Rhododendron vialii]
MSFLEDFQANLESLPNILQRKYTLLRDLDKSLQEVQRQNEQGCDQEIEEMKREIRSGNLAPDASKLRFSDEAVDEQKHAIRIADEKVALASQAYELVDSHIQQLDQYLKKYDEDLRRDRESVATTGSSVQNVDSNNKPMKGSESGRGGRKKTRLGATTAATSAAAANPTSMDLDLPVDPNEPTYCFCNQVSYGEMVACDNPDVCIHSSIYLIFSFFLAVFRSRISGEICGGKEYNNNYMG